jgi:hypothetical protein
MKSEKAKEFINHITPNKANFAYCAEKGGLNGSIYADVCKAIEIAEQEAEERMREKAVKIFTEILYMPARQLAKECGVSVDDVEEDSGIDYCRILFIQKLTE